MKDRVAQLYKDAHELITKAKGALAASGELSEVKRQEIDQWLSQAEQIEKRAKDLEKVMARDAELLAEENQKQAVDRQNEQKAQQAQSDFKDGAEFMVAVYNARKSNKYDPRLEALEKKDLSGEVGISGGFLLPTQLRQDILTARGEVSFLRSRAKIVPMSTRVIQYPALDYSQGAAGVSAFFGGVQVYYTEDNAAITESQPRWKQVELHLRSLAGYCEIPNSLIQDSPISLTSFLQGQNSFGGALAFKEDYDALRGAGAGKLLGILNSPAKLTVTRNASTDFKFVDAVTMKSKMLMSGAPAWVINQSVMPKLYQFVDAGNNNLFLPAVRGVDGKPSDMLLGYPILWTEKLPALGTQGDVCLVDFAYYLLGDRGEIRMDIDTSFKFQNDQTAFKVVERVDGQPWLANTITLADGSTTVSPYVVLN